MLVKLLGSTEFTVVTAGLGGVLAFLFGAWTPLLTALLVIQLADIVTGFLVGGKRKEISSETFFEGLKKKVGMWILLILANVIDTTLIAGVPVCKSAVSGFLIAGEGLSLLENIGLLGVPIPEQIKKFLEQLREDNAAKEFVKQKGEDLD